MKIKIFSLILLLSCFLLLICVVACNSKIIGNKGDLNNIDYTRAVKENENKVMNSYKVKINDKIVTSSKEIQDYVLTSESMENLKNRIKSAEIVANKYPLIKEPVDLFGKDGVNIGPTYIHWLSSVSECKMDSQDIVVAQYCVTSINGDKHWFDDDSYKLVIFEKGNYSVIKSIFPEGDSLHYKIDFQVVNIGGKTNDMIISANTSNGGFLEKRIALNGGCIGVYERSGNNIRKIFYADPISTFCTVNFADLDNDGVSEMIISSYKSQNTVHRETNIYKYKDGDFKQVGDFNSEIQGYFNPRTALGFLDGEH